MLPSLYIKGPNVLFLFNTALAFKKKNGILNMVLKAEVMTVMMKTMMITIMMVYIWRIKWIYIMLNVEA